jgi:hypothetical protein
LSTPLLHCHIQSSFSFSCSWKIIKIKNCIFNTSQPDLDSECLCIFTYFTNRKKMSIALWRASIKFISRRAKNLRRGKLHTADDESSLWGANNFNAMFIISKNVKLQLKSHYKCGSLFITILIDFCVTVWILTTCEKGLQCKANERGRN